MMPELTVPSLAVSPKHSTLELVQHDSTIQAPEPANAMIGPESQNEFDALQVAPEPGPETLFTDCPPEVVQSPKTSEFNNTTISKSPRLCGLPPITAVIIFAILAVITVGVGVGVGVGFGLRGKTSGENLSSTVTMTANSSTTPEPPAASSQSLEILLLNDTSIAASSFHGEHRLFFQDRSGIIRQAIYSASTGRWSSDHRYVVASDAKNHTPIAVVNITSSLRVLSPYYAEKIFVFYIFSNNTIACAEFGKGVWIGSCIPQLSKFTAAQNSRQLSVTMIPDDPNDSTILIYEDTHNEVKVILRSRRVNSIVWGWQDITSKLYATVPGIETKFSAPFGSCVGDSSTWQAIFTEMDSNGYHTSAGLMTEYSISSKNFSTTETHNFLPPEGAEKSDMLMMDIGHIEGAFDLLWVNNTELEHFSPSSDIPIRPTSPFPFTRLGGFAPPNGTGFFLYHQLNNSAFAEDQWDVDLSEWFSTSFTVLIT